MRLYLILALVSLSSLASAEVLKPGNTANGPAEMPTGDHLLNINQTPKSPRFINIEKKWPEKPGDADVCLWADDKVAAWSIEIDDNQDQDIPWWEEQAKSRGGSSAVPLTWFVITGNVGKGGNGSTWDTFKRLQDEGFHMESHTVTHYWHLDPSWQGVDWDYSQSIKDLNAGLPNQATHFMAYPGGANPNPNDRDIAAKYYMSVRGGVGTPIKANMIDYLNVNGYHPVIGNPRNSWSDPTNVLDPKNQYYRAWTDMFWHAIDHKPGASPMDSASETATKAVLDWAVGHRDDLWGDFYGNVAMYGEERDTAKLATTSVDADKIVFSLTSQMDPALYTFPLTVKVRLPDAWGAAAKATQAGKPADVVVIDHDNAHFALVKAVPGAGDVTLTAGK